MKIILEETRNKEIEVIIRGDIADKKVQHILTLLKSATVVSKIILNDEEKERLMDIDDILYFETKGGKVYASTLHKKYLSKYALSELLRMFQHHGIIQIGKSLLVNVHYVQCLEAEFSGNYVITLKNKEKLLVSRFYMKGFRNAIMEG